MRKTGQNKMYTVLYIEESPQVFARTAKLISRLGYFLYVAENGREGLRICQEVNPDIIITDISMSVMSGMELAREARLIDENVRIILTVSSDQSNLLLNSFDLNIDCYLAKPVDPDHLSKALTHCSRKIDVVNSISIPSKEAEEEIRKLNAELEYRVLRRTALLDATNRELDDFCDAISHELCGPLSRLQGLGKAFYEDCLDTLDNTGKDYLTRISQTTVQLKQIIDALISLTQLTRRSMALQDVNLSMVCGDIVQTLTTSGRSRAVKFFIAPDISVKGDKALLTIVMESLLNNAWENVEGYPQPRIEFGVARSSEKTVYFVRDNGRGFDSKYSGKLFKLFNHSINKDQGITTTGTGLVAAQRIIQRHGGRIWAEGELEKGATFYFTI